ncbi:MAG TPA: hypothetical protein VIO59_01445, partial [Rhodanobacter sp.]
TPHGHGSDALCTATGRLGQRRGHGHAEFGRHGSTANEGGTQACKAQAEKIVKELHQPISS